MRVQEIHQIECDVPRCLREATHFVFMDLELFGGMAVAVRLRLCAQHKEEIRLDYDSSGNGQRAEAGDGTRHR